MGRNDAGGDSPEDRLARWATNLRYEDIPDDVVAGMKLLVRTIFGTAVAGATSDGCGEVVEQVRQWGGTPEATIWRHGGRAPVHAAVLANSTMARALDICDFAIPGQHIGTSIVPVALGVAELVGGVSGRDLITALAAGSEIAVRLGAASRLDGFDPTGACSIFAPAIAAARLLGHDEVKMAHTLALTFNKAGASFQNNVDGSLAVRLVQGFVSQDAVICAQLAGRGLTGPRRWLTGVWGYYHLFCKDLRNDALVAGELGETWFARQFGYKTRPQCGATIASTDAVLQLLTTETIDPDAIERIDIAMANEAPCTLVGSGFALGPNPQVNGQFNVRYCVANAIVRGSSRLEHFTNEAVSDPVVGALAQRVETRLDPDLMEGKPELVGRVRIAIHMKDGSILNCGTDKISGMGELAKSEEEHLADYREHMAYGGKPLHRDAADRLARMVAELETLPDVRVLVPMLDEQSALIDA